MACDLVKAFFFLLLLQRNVASCFEISDSPRICVRVCQDTQPTNSEIERSLRATNIKILFLRIGCQCPQQNIEKGQPRQRRSPDDTAGASTSVNNTNSTETFSSTTPQQDATRAAFTKRSHDTSCKQPNTSVFKIQMNPSVTFKKVNNTWQAVIFWKQLEGEDYQKLEYYRVQWIEKSNRDDIICESTPKDTTEMTITASENWNYPNAILLAVNPMPQSLDRTKLDLFDPQTYPSPKLFVPKKNVTTLIISICGGIVGGLVLLAVALWYRKKHKPQRHLFNSYPHVPREGSYVVSYYPENEEYILRVVKLVDWFRKMGYDVTMDKMATNELSQMGPEKWAARKINRAHKVLVLCSSTYVQLCVDRDEALVPCATQEQTRVLYEVGLLAHHHFCTQSTSKMVCILMEENIPVNDLPLWMRVTYRWPEAKENILLRLNDRNEYESVG